MDSSMIKGAVIGGIAMVVLGAGGITGYKSLTRPRFADVVAVPGDDLVIGRIERT